MENIVRFPSEISIIQYPIYKDIKNVESIIFDDAYKYFMIITSPNIIFVYDNFTKLCIGKLDILEIMKDSSINDDYAPLIKQIIEKEKGRLFDCFAFSKNPDYIAVGSTKLATIFLFKTGFTSLTPGEEQPNLVGYIKIQNPAAKEYKMSFSMDPLNKYNCVISGNTVSAYNLKSLAEYQIWSLNPENDNLQKKDKDMGDELRISYSLYVNRFCTKTRKRLISFCLDALYIYELEYDPIAKGHSKSQILNQLNVSIQLRLSKFVLNMANDYIAMIFSKKIIKVLSIDQKNNILYPKIEFEANEGRTLQDVGFGWYNNQNEEPADWLILLEKHQPLMGLAWYDLTSKDLKNYLFENNIRLKAIYPNPIWKGSLIAITDTGSLLNLEFKQPQSWVNFSYKFSAINENVEYLEREDEFDLHPEDTKTFNPLQKSDIDAVSEKAYSNLLRINPKQFPGQIVQKLEHEINHSPLKEQEIEGDQIVAEETQEFIKEETST